MMDVRAVAADDKSQIIQIVIWFVCIVAVFSVGARMGTKYIMTRKLAWDDWLMLIAQVTYLAQCISISLGASQGLGKPDTALSNEAIDNFLKAEYASTAFLILTLALIKWSISVFIQHLSPGTMHQRLDNVLRIIVGLWLLSAMLASLFECAIPAPWDYINGAQCIDRRAWWTYVSVVNVITEVFIITLYTIIIGKIQISRLRRAIVISIFSLRLLVIGIVIAQLVIFLDEFPGSGLTGSSWLPVVLNQIVLGLSVVTACAPYLKPFMESLESSIVRVETIPGSEEELSGDRIGLGGYYSNNLSNSTACSSHR
ncbi:hypothetical protein F4677DRAFT_438689 [Hypoxylon crocopeplum]|nr:hypothetical protein F4677DRAFT_438689 [Hypoxylon crocopeplum]